MCVHIGISAADSLCVPSLFSLCLSVLICDFLLSCVISSCSRAPLVPFLLHLCRPVPRACFTSLCRRLFLYVCSSLGLSLIPCLLSPDVFGSRFMNCTCVSLRVFCFSFLGISLSIYLSLAFMYILGTRLSEREIGGVLICCSVCLPTSLLSNLIVLSLGRSLACFCCRDLAQ